MKLIQFSPGRTGSTLIWNILKELYPNVKKAHQIKYSTDIKIISSIRDPRDILKSRLLITGKPIDKAAIDTEVGLMFKHGMSSLIAIKNKPNVLILRYEEFLNNYDYIFDSVEQFLNISITEDKRIELRNKYAISKMKQISDNFNTFASYDKTTHIHGRHISDSNEPGGWVNIIPVEYHNYISEKLEQCIKILDY